MKKQIISFLKVELKQAKLKVKMLKATIESIKSGGEVVGEEIIHRLKEKTLEKINPVVETESKDLKINATPYPIEDKLQIQRNGEVIFDSSEPKEKEESHKIHTEPLELTTDQFKEQLPKLKADTKNNNASIGKEIGFHQSMIGQFQLHGEGSVRFKQDLAAFFNIKITDLNNTPKKEHPKSKPDLNPDIVFTSEMDSEVFRAKLPALITKYGTNKNQISKAINYDGALISRYLSGNKTSLKYIEHLAAFFNIKITGKVIPAQEPKIKMITPKEPKTPPV